MSEFAQKFEKLLQGMGQKSAGTKVQWTAEENALLTTLVNQRGHAWAAFAKEHFSQNSSDGKLHVRSEDALKQQWNKLKKSRTPHCLDPGRLLIRVR